MNKHDLLKKHFGYDSFRPLQEQIIDDVLAHKDLMVVMPTGGGKSMCFQLPSLMLEGVTLVVSPLIALMKDQVDSLRANGITAGYFNSSQVGTEQQEMLQLLKENRLKLLYVAPESIQLLLHHLKPTDISLIAIDEAHCISTWGHDFRPAYTQLAYLKKSFPEAGLIALTATADRATRADIKKQLAISHAQEYVASFDRPNLTLEVRPGNDRLAQVRRFLKKYQDESGIIYCLSRKSCEKLSDKLSSLGFSVAAYHAGLEHRFRESVQEQFIKDEIKIVCATIAFGMGIDKSNVRFVIHYNMPKNIEGYYQEIGRAGRDGIDAHALLFHSYADVIQLRNFASDSGNSEVQIAKLERMKQFADALTCRRRMLLSYFNEYLENDCGNCDVCLNKPDFFDATLIAQKALSAVYRMNENASLNLLIDVLRGAQNATVLDSGFQAIKTYGAGRDISWNNWQQYIIQMINQGLLEIAFHEFNHLKLTPQAKAVLFEKQPVKLAVIPKPEELAARNTRAVQEDLPSEINKDLYAGLRKLRMQIASQENLAPYMVFSDATLKDIASRIPLTIDEFEDITGVGKHKLDTYGEIFLNLTQGFEMMREGDFIYRVVKTKPKKKKKNGPKKDTVMESVQLYWAGKTLEEISEIRALKTDTILTHLGKRYVSHKDVDLNAHLSSEEVKEIEPLYATYEKEKALKPLFEHFNGKYSYGKLRLAMYLIEATVTIK
ncbi:DNA helicase RecQ [Nonlabens mediterrranea]|uniref:DNA helicase RecQ n=1 Tax=Nonlabens mediterrranea TaxID=1419947 RepID=A0ABS0AB57_9FLAO|nr:DNA helicase RecQ [Nonlabens mediterrranea]